jgi:hypothetical protein
VCMYACVFQSIGSDGGDGGLCIAGDVGGHLSPGLCLPDGLSFFDDAVGDIVVMSAAGRSGSTAQQFMHADMRTVLCPLLHRS